MILTLTPQGFADGRPLRLDRRGAVLGRMPDADIVLPAAAVSSRHCRVDWHDGAYILTDTSSNGTLRNGQPSTAPVRLADGDWLEIGPYRIGVSLAAGSETGSPPLPRSMNLSSWDRGVDATPPLLDAPRLAVSQTIRQAAAPSSISPPSLISPPVLPPPMSPPQTPMPPGTDVATALLHAVGLARTAVDATDAAILAAAGALLRQLTAGTMTLLAARSQARAELGVSATRTPDAGPLNLAASAETALAQLLGRPAAAATAVAADFADLGKHQQAILHAMQGALRATLDTLAPDAIRQRLQGAGKTDAAALWRVYEAAFAGAGNDASFIELFARELREAYTKAGG